VACSGLSVEALDPEASDPSRRIRQAIASPPADATAILGLPGQARAENGFVVRCVYHHVDPRREPRAVKVLAHGVQKPESGSPQPAATGKANGCRNFFNDQMRTERDSMGDIEVPADKLWGAQTQRQPAITSNFTGNELMPVELVPRTYSSKRACAAVNVEPRRAGMPKKGRAIIQAADEALFRAVSSDNFPLVVWQTGSGNADHT